MKLLLASHWEGLKVSRALGWTGKEVTPYVFTLESDWSDASRKRGGCGGRFGQLDGMFCENGVPERAR